MTELVVKTREGDVIHIESEEGISVMEAIRGAGIDELAAVCGGACSCATCHIHVDQAFMGRLPPMSEAERDLLSTSDYFLENSRLACQVPMNGALHGLLVTIAPYE